MSLMDEEEPNQYLIQLHTEGVTLSGVGRYEVDNSWVIIEQSSAIVVQRKGKVS